MSKTAKEITMEFRGESIIIPKGTKITHNTALGYDENYNFIDEFNWYKPELKGFAREMAINDMVHYGIDIKPEFVESV